VGLAQSTAGELTLAGDPGPLADVFCFNLKNGLMENRFFEAVLVLMFLVF